MVDIKIEGMEELSVTLKAIPEEMRRGSDSPIWKALRDAGNVIRDEAKNLAPVKTGRLRDSIKVRRRPKRINKKRGNDDPAVQVVPVKHQHIATWVEFGTGAFFTGGTGGLKMAAGGSVLGSQIGRGKGRFSLQNTPIKPRRKKILFSREDNEIYGAGAMGQAPQPFMRPALERAWRDAIEAFRVGFGKKLKTLERRLAKR